MSASSSSSDSSGPNDSIVSTRPRTDRTAYVRNEGISFLPADGDMLLITKDNTFKGELNLASHFTAFALQKSDLIRESPFFDDMFSSTTGDGRQYINLSQGATTVLLVLSATFEPERSFLTTNNVWSYFDQALRLAAKLQFERARHGIFMAMLSMASNPQKSLGSRVKITEFFAEAASEGDSALSMAMLAFRHRYGQQRSAIPIAPLKVTQHHFMALGSECCSKFVDAILDLTMEGIFRR